MKIAITGASGFVGTRLTAALRQAGVAVKPLPRGGVSAAALDGVDAVVHLAGEPVAQRWTVASKDRILRSRVEGTAGLVQAMGACARRPRVLVSASAIGYYGDRGDEILTELSHPGAGFLAEVCVAWEREAERAHALDVRVVRVRFGIVLGPDGGALEKMLLPFRFGLGGRIGSGDQWMSWVHAGDAVRLIRFALEREDCAGAMNVTAPNPVRNDEFTRALGKVLRRPVIIPVPLFGLRMMYGEMAGTLTASQRVEPTVAQRMGFAFEFTRLEEALGHLLM